MSFTIASIGTVYAENVQISQFTHLAFVFSGGKTMTAYQNGAMVSTVMGSNGSLANCTAIYLAKNKDFKGIVDEIAVYKRALTSKEIQDIALSGNSKLCRTM